MKNITLNHEVKNMKWSMKIMVISLLLMLSMQIQAQTDTIQTNVPALKDVFTKDFYIGCLLSYKNIGFSTDPKVDGQSNVITPNGGYLIKYHMSSMSPGNNMKPQYTVKLSECASAYAAASAADKDSVDTHPVIRFNGDIIAQLNWAQRQGFTFRGHTLVWHSQTPGTGFFRTGYTDSGARLSKEKMTERMENYIKEIIRLIHEGWPGLLSAFDVVNEAVNDNGSDRTGDSEWYTTFGDNTYLMKAFEFARKYTVQYGETQIKLYYNDYNTSTSTKADGIVRICTPIFQAGYLDGIGMQEHDGYSSPTAAQWIASYNKFYPICNEMAVTELDVKPSSTTLSSSVLTSQANQYAMLMKCFVERSYKSGRGKIISVCKDGLNDQYAFVSMASLWDAKNQCKPAFFAVADVGNNYNYLDTLIARADTITQRKYSNDSWTQFTTALADAKTAFGKNYSYTVSAATALSDAKTNLISAIDSLKESTTGVEDITVPKVYTLSQN